MIEFQKIERAFKRLDEVEGGWDVADDCVEYGRLLLDVARAADDLPVDMLICYGSTASEYKPNAQVRDLNKALTALREHC